MESSSLPYGQAQAAILLVVVVVVVVAGCAGILHSNSCYQESLPVETADAQTPLSQRGHACVCVCMLLSFLRRATIVVLLKRSSAKPSL